MRMENILSIIPTGNNMIKPSLNLDPKLPRHMCEMITGMTEYRRIAYPTPGFVFPVAEILVFSEELADMYVGMLYEYLRALSVR